MDTSKTSVSRIEAGKQPYTQDYLERIAVILQTSPASLLERDPNDDNTIWPLWEKALPGQRKKIVKVAKDLLQVS